MKKAKRETKRQRKARAAWEEGRLFTRPAPKTEKGVRRARELFRHVSADLAARFGRPQPSETALEPFPRQPEVVEVHDPEPAEMARRAIETTCRVCGNSLGFCDPEAALARAAPEAPEPVPSSG